MAMLPCPGCGQGLSRAATPLGVVHYCGGCGGRLLGLAAQPGDAVDAQFRADLWRTAAYASTGERACPHCRHPMRRAIMPPRYGGVELDVCRHCMAVWFDPGEYGALAHERQEEETGRYGPDSRWKLLPAIFGLPVEVSSPRLSSVPVITWLTAAAIGAVTLLNMGRLGPLAEAYGFVPEQWSRHGGLTLVASFFLHGGLLHLLGNAYFLLVFGDNVEDRLGRGRFLLLLLLSHLAGAALHGWFEPRGELPLVGASAGIFGVVAFYAAAFPRARLGLLMFYLFWLRLPAWTLLLFYIATQLLGAMAQVSGYGSVSSLGHLGGLAVGLLFALLWRHARGTGAAASAGLRDGYRRGERD